MTKKTMMIADMAMVMGLSTTAMAAGGEPSTITNTEESKTGTMNLEFKQDESYTVTIPADVKFGTDSKTNTSSLNASNVYIPLGKKLTVNVSGQNYDQGWKLKTEGGDTLTYTFQKGKTSSVTDVTNGGEVLSVAAGNQTGEESLTFNLTGDIKNAGTYRDTLTFTVALQ